MAATKNHDYHLVEPDPWPLIGAISGGILFGGARHVVPRQPLRQVRRRRSGLLGVLVTMYNWWANTIREAHTGYHTPVVQLHLRYGMILFIASEVMFFLAWFWAFFDSSLFPSAVEAVGGQWPPKGIEVLEPVGLPAAQHLDPAVLGHDGHLGAPFADPRRPQWAEARAAADDPARPHVHQHPGLGICPRAVRLQRQHLRLDLLHGDRLPRLPRDRRDDLPDRLPDPRQSRATSRRGSISASRRPPGTGISSTSCGCSCSRRSTSGAAGARRTRGEPEHREPSRRRSRRRLAAIARAAASTRCSTAGCGFAERAASAGSTSTASTSATGRRHS